MFLRNLRLGAIMGAIAKHALGITGEMNKAAPKVATKKSKNTGRMLWDSARNGTYIRAKHGELR